MFTKKELNAIVKKASNKVIKKAKKELNAVAKRKKDNLDDDRLEASINNLETLNQQMKNVDKHIQEFILRSTEIDVWRLGQDKMKLAESALWLDSIGIVHLLLYYACLWCNGVWVHILLE